MAELKYIPDRVLNLYEEDLLGTLVYVETIKKIIENCETPYTIGLFGSWGSGKSSILKTLQEKLNNDKTNKIGVFIYDAWKYSKDDFRRTFILDLRKNFGLDTKEEEELFYKDKVEDIQYKPKLDKYSLIALVISIFLIGLFGYCFLHLNLIQNLFGSLSLAGLLSILFSFFRQVLVYHRIAITTSKLFAPEKFEERFKNTIKEIRNPKIDKLVIAIDNIDRCHEEQVLEILLTVKNFLEVEGVIFIISVDEKGLKKFLKMSDSDANEFLRKLFNSTVYIKNFSSMELYEFGKRLLEKYEINFPRKENVIALICQEFSRNPRKIIQFLNVLQTEYNLAEIQENKGFLPKGAITNNIEMLVKILIIREEYPEIFKKINDDKNLLKEIHDAIREGKFKKDESGLWEYDKLKEIKLTEEQYRFFKRTLNIEMDSKHLEAFFLTKDILKNIPDKAYELIIKQDWESLKNMLDKNEIEFKDLINLIDQHTNEYVLKRELYDTYGFNLSYLIFQIIADQKYGNQIEQLPQNINSMLHKGEIYNLHTFKFPFREFIFALKRLKENNIEYPINKVIEKINTLTIDYLKKDKNPIQLLKEFVYAFGDKPNMLIKIRSKLSDLLSQDFNLYFEFKEILERDVIKYLLDDAFVNNIIPTLNQNYNSDFTREKVEIIKRLNKYGVLKEEIKTKYLTTAISIIENIYNYNYQQVNWDFFSFWLEAILGFVEGIKDLNIVNQLYNVLNKYFNRVSQSFSSRRLEEINIKTYKAYISILGELFLVMKDKDKKSTIVNWLNNFFNPNISEDVFLQINQLYQKIVRKTNEWLFADNVINQMLNQNNAQLKLELSKTVNLMMLETKEDKGLTEEQINKVINHYFELLFNNQDVKNWIFEICENDFIANKVIDYIAKIEDPEKLEKSTEILKVLIDRFGFDKFYRKIRALLASSDNREQIVGISILDQVKEKIPNEKKSLILKLLEEINENDLPKDVVEKLKTIEKFFH